MPLVQCVAMNQSTHLFPLFQVLPSCLLGLFRSFLVRLAQLGSLLLLLLGSSLGSSLGLVGLLLLSSRKRFVGCSIGGSTLLCQSSGLFVGLDSLDSGVRSQNFVDESSESDIVFLLPSCSLRLVLLFRESLVVSAKGQRNRTNNYGR